MLRLYTYEIFIIMRVAIFFALALSENSTAMLTNKLLSSTEYLITRKLLVMTSLLLDTCQYGV